MKKTNLKYLIYSIIIVVLLFSISCSTEKNTALTRTYHNITAMYNVYFNGNEAYQRGLNRIKSQYSENYNELLPIFPESNENAASIATGDMDRAINKASKTIKLHSITAKPERRGTGPMTDKEREFYEKNEYCKWIDDSYLLMGKSYLIKRDFHQARHNFEYIIRQFPNEDTKYSAYLYLSRTYIEQGNYVNAKEIFDLLEADREFPEDMKKDLALIYADYYLRQSQYEASIPRLNTTIEEIRRHRKKVRYLYILAQIHERLGNLMTASNYYAKAARRNSDYEMEINAKINMAKCFVGGGEDTRDILRQLNRMLRDDKNMEYLDQIHFAIAEIYLRIDDTENAIENYKKSSEKSVFNDYQKAISCLRLAEIYFELKDYKNSSIYYDTCMMFLPQSYENYREVRQNAMNLAELTKYTNIVEFQDSVQKVALLNEAERNQLIDKIIAEVIEQEKLERDMERQDQLSSMLFDERRHGRQDRTPSSGRWYMYDPAQLSFGQNEFRKKWGRRQNEDHWRRSNKEIIDMYADFEDGESPDSIQEPRITDNKKREYYLQDIPLTDSMMQVSHSKILESLFNIGKIYQEKFNNYELAINAFEELNSRYPDNEYLLLSYYNLYLLSKLTDKTDKKQTYKDLLVAKFPDTHYANLLKNPNYIIELNEKRKKNEQLYIDTYDNYVAGRCDVVTLNADDFIENNPEGELTAKFAYLKTLCVGKTSKQSEFQLALVEFMRAYPEDELYIAAQNILEYFGTTDIESLIADLESRPLTEEISKDIKVQDSLAVLPEELFSFEEMEAHFYVIKIHSESIDEKRLSFEIRNFNIFNFSLRTFSVTTYNYDEGHQLIVVKTFNNQRQAINYRNMIANNNDVFGNLNHNDYEIFVISEENYNLLREHKNYNEYMQFYAIHYTP